MVVQQTNYRRLIAVMILFLTFGNTVAQTPPNITYIANEGVLINVNDHLVLIDAVFDEFYSHLPSPDTMTLHAMINGQSPFKNISLMLITHSHRDHFSPLLVGKFLANNPDTQLITTTQSYDSMEQRYGGFDAIADRVHFKLPSSVWNRYAQEGLQVNYAHLRHINPRNYKIENNCFVLSIEGKKVLHIGDADTDMKQFDAVNLGALKFDVALVPAWFLASIEGKQIIEKHIHAQQLIGIHYPKSGGEMMLKGIQQQFPKAIVFQQQGEKFEF